MSKNIEVGGKYEVVLTKRDGLLRYHLGDVIEVVGFHSRDDQQAIHSSIEVTYLMPSTHLSPT